MYGTTAYGGNSRNCSLGCGTVFKITPGGTLASLYSFPGPAGGFYPSTRLVQATDGNFFGTTSVGGVNCSGAGCGTIFKMTRSGTVATIYSFCALANCADGEFPTRD